MLCHTIKAMHALTPYHTKSPCTRTHICHTPENKTMHATHARMYPPMHAHPYIHTDTQSRASTPTPTQAYAHNHESTRITQPHMQTYTATPTLRMPPPPPPPAPTKKYAHATLLHRTHDATPQPSCHHKSMHTPNFLSCQLKLPPTYSHFYCVLSSPQHIVL